MVKFGAFTDAHYAKDLTVGNRNCYKSCEKLETILPKMQHCDFIVNLGDLINGTMDRDFDEMCLNTVMETLAPYKVFHVIGNHDAFALPKEKILPSVYDIGCAYSFDMEGFRFIFLDANFYDNGDSYNSSRHEWDNSIIPQFQIKWLKNELAECNNAIIFCHQNLDDRICHGVERDPHCIINAGEVREVIEKSGKVKYVFQGHYHDGCETVIGGINYLTLPALCEKDSQTYFIITINKDEILVQSF